MSTLAHSRQSVTLMDRFLAPATRLMSQLRFNQKAVVIGAAFMLTCGVLAGILVVRSNAEVTAATQQRDAVTGLGHLHRAMRIRVRGQNARACRPADGSRELRRQSGEVVGDF